jgi:creatinine amidohydrolase
MPLFKLEELKYPELDGFDRGKTLFTVVVSPLEEHGPHLPLGVDAFNAKYFDEELSRRFLEKHPEWNVVHMPPLLIGSYAFEAVGTITVASRTLRKLLIDYLSSIAKYGFSYFLISNAHGGPTHVVALEEASRIVSKRFQVRVVSFGGHIIWKLLRGEYWPEIEKRLGLKTDDRKALQQDAHAGQWETSMMLKLRPDLVDPVYKTLSPFTTKLVNRLRKNYPLKMGEKLGYVGDPSRANKELGDVSSEFLMEKAFEMVETDLFSKKLPRPSMFYRLTLFRTNFLRMTLLILLLAILLFILSFYH